jgi:large subunit ribosomal protein L31
MVVKTAPNACEIRPGGLLCRLISLFYACGAGFLSPVAVGFTSESLMKAGIHPEYTLTQVTCSCGNVFETRSTLGQKLSIEVCANCHPFYTGKQKIMDTGGRVNRFKERFGGFGSVSQEDKAGG